MTAGRAGRVTEVAAGAERQLRRQHSGRRGGDVLALTAPVGAVMVGALVSAGGLTRDAQLQVTTTPGEALRLRGHGRASRPALMLEGSVPGRGRGEEGWPVPCPPCGPRGPITVPAAEPADAAVPQSRGLKAESRRGRRGPRGLSPGHADGRLLLVSSLDCLSVCICVQISTL